jgi:ribonuclease P protein component
MGKRFTYANRLHKRSEYDYAYANGKVLRNSKLVIYYVNRTIDKPARLGITVSRKHGNAVVRNRLKRLVRESFREVLPELAPGYDIVIHCRGSCSSASFAEVLASLKRLLTKAGIRRSNEED